MKRSILTMFICLCTSLVFCQITDRVACGGQEMRTSRSKPTFGKSAGDIQDYFTNKIEWQGDKQQRGIFQVQMNCKGELYSAEMITGNISEDQQAEIKKLILEMPEWKAAEFDGATDYLFYMDFLYRSNKLVVNLEMR